MGSKTRYWVVGAEFTDTSFEDVHEGSERVLGPFIDYAAAHAAWQTMAEATRCEACTRFTIAREG